MNTETTQSPIRAMVKARVATLVTGLTHSRGCAGLDTLLDSFPDACRPIALQAVDELILAGDISADGFTLKWTGSTEASA